MYYGGMTKPLNLKVDRSAKTTLAEQIRHGIATAIESGVLEPGTRLPSWRTSPPGSALPGALCGPPMRS
jgi:GntR family transcriptional regulator/MocR family aminotransferase